jgi:hypothetical protein
MGGKLKGGLGHIVLVLGNLFWAGLGNILIGDERGWNFGMFTWIAVVLAFFTGGVSIFAWGAYCITRGSNFLNRSSWEAVTGQH